jgi:hypothetical protein
MHPAWKPINVIPAKAGIQVFPRIAKSSWIPGIKGVALNQQHCPTISPEYSHSPKTVRTAKVDFLDTLSRTR